MRTISFFFFILVHVRALTEARIEGYSINFLQTCHLYKKLVRNSEYGISNICLVVGIMRNARNVNIGCVQWNTDACILIGFESVGICLQPLTYASEERWKACVPNSANFSNIVNK
jgi:hypothetical protein